MSHELYAAPSSIGVRDRAADSANKAVGRACHRASWFVIAIKYVGTGACDKGGMVPDFTFLVLEELVDEGLIGSKFCLGKAKNVCSYILHLEE